MSWPPLRIHLPVINPYLKKKVLSLGEKARKILKN